MTRRNEDFLVFISCGQVHPQEIKLGQRLAELVNGIPGLKAYFAQNETSFDGVSKNILGALDRCVAFVAIMHERGDVTFEGRTTVLKRASVWIEQEIAIASFIQHRLGRSIEAVVYAKRGIEREGLRDKLLLNVHEFESEDEVIADFIEHRLENIRTAAGLAEARREEDEQNLQSPLGQIQFFPLTLEPQPTNPDFIVGVHVVPWSYPETTPSFDNSDVRKLAEIIARSRVDHVNNLNPKGDRFGVLFASEENRERRSDGAPTWPARQIYICRDGRFTIRYLQDDASPFRQVVATLLEAYRIGEALFDLLGLLKRARFHLRGNLHAGRKAFSPVMPSYFNEHFDGRFGAQSFVDVVSGAVESVLSSEGQPFERVLLRNALNRFQTDGELSPIIGS